MRYLLILLPILLLSGCATGDYKEYATSLSYHSASEGQRIAAQANSISEMVQATRTETPTEGVLLAVIGMMQVERLQPVQMQITKPTTGADVGLAFVQHIPFAAAMGGMVWQSSILADSIGKGLTMTDSTITGSYNPTTSVAGGTASAVGTATPTIVRPEVVRPEVIRISPEIKTLEAAF
jgi:hypothetical protein